MKILVISQHLFPIQTPRAHRTTELVKELSRQGHDVTVYAVLGQQDYSTFESTYNIQVKNIPIHFQKHPYNSDGDGKRTIIDKILGRLLGKILEFPNIEFTLRVPEIIQKENNFDALITIADPHQIHWGAAKARKRNPNNFPPVWIADCGDPFMMNQSKNGHLAYFARFEKSFCRLCDYITVPVIEAKNAYYSEFRDKIRIIPQGFEFTIENNPAPDNAVITFAYAGTFYQDIRNPSAFLNFISSLAIDFKFVVYTLHTELLIPYKKKLGNRLEIRKPLDRIKLIEELKKMDFLLNIENIKSPSQIPSKLIDYAITGRPILSINPRMSSTDAIVEFLNRDFSKQLVVHDIENYQISNVTRQFIDLINEKHK